MSPTKRSTVRRARALIVGVVTASILGTGCASAERGTLDAPIDVRLQDNSAPFIVNMPDKFMNIAIKCIGPNGIYAHTREAPPVVIPDDPICVQGTVGVAELVKRSSD